MSSGERSTVISVIAKIAALEMLLGGPLLVSDDLRPLIGKAAAIVVVVLPIVLFYIGAEALADSEGEPTRETPLRLGLIGAWLVAPMNLYAINRLLQGEIRFGATTPVGILICTIVLAAYFYLARRRLRRAELTLERTREDFGDPIE
jgi:hypothetical protein